MSSQMPPNFTETKEFQDAVSAAASKAATEAFAKLRETMEKPETLDGMADRDASLMRGLQEALSGLVNMSSGRKVEAPYVTMKREEAGKNLVELVWSVNKEILAAYRRREDTSLLTPTYKVIMKQYLDEQFVEPYTKKPGEPLAQATEIEYRGIPNEGLVPTNKIAKRIHALWREFSGRPEIVPTADNRDYHVTHGGMVIKGAPARKNHVGDGRRSLDHFSFNESLTEDDIGSPNDPNAPLVRVLGKTAAPARQSGLPQITHR